MGKAAQTYLLIAALILFVVYSVFVFIYSIGWRHGFIFAISGAFGFMLKYGEFGYMRTFKEFVTEFKMHHTRKMLLMLFIATLCCSIIDIINTKPLFLTTKKSKYSKSTAPLGISLVIGSFLFGIGMVLGSGCASGTLMLMGGRKKYNLIDLHNK